MEQEREGAEFTRRLAVTHDRSCKCGHAASEHADGPLFYCYSCPGCDDYREAP